MTALLRVENHYEGVPAWNQYDYTHSYSSSSLPHSDVCDEWPTGSGHVTLNSPVHHVGQQTEFSSSYDMNESVAHWLEGEEQQRPSVFELPPVFETSAPNERFDDCTALSIPLSPWPSSVGDNYSSHSSIEDGGIPWNNYAQSMCFVNAGDTTNTTTTTPLPAALSTPHQTPPATMLSSGYLRCWQHGCGGRSFSSLSNYRRHCKEKDGQRAKAICPRCGRKFSRTAARELHFSQNRCEITLVDANMIPFRVKMKETLSPEPVAGTTL
jgi:hypothetical protein